MSLHDMQTLSIVIAVLAPVALGVMTFARCPTTPKRRRKQMQDAIKFTERLPMDAQTVSVFCDEWTAPKVMIFRENWNGQGSPRLTCESDGRHYWYPERMTWRPHFELKAVS